MGAQSSTVTISETNEPQRPMKAEVHAQKPLILDQTEGKEWEELEGKKVAELQQTFNSFHDKLTEKESVDVPEGLVMFVTALTSEGSDSMSGIPKLVDGIGTTWGELMKDEKQIRRCVGDKEMDLLKQNRQRYYLLLLETRTVVQFLLSQSHIKQRQVRKLSKMAKKAIDAGGVLKKGETKTIFEQNMRNLMKWIDETKLRSITEKWGALINDLEGQKTRFERVREEMEKKYNKLSRNTKWAGRIGCLVGFASMVALIAGSVLVCPVTLAVGGVLAAGFGALLLTQAFFDIRALQNPKHKAMIEKMKTIHEMLQKYINFGNEVQGKLQNLEQSQAGILPETDYILTTDEWEDVSESLDQIMKHLEDYITHGYEAANSLEKACEEYRRGN